MIGGHGVDPVVLDAGWRRGVDETVAWAQQAAGDGDALMFVDAPLAVRNRVSQRLCETQVGQRYGRWKVSANTSNLRSPRLAGVRFLALAEACGWKYSDGSGGPPRGGRVLSETYPYATLVGAPELGYDTERPRYKRKPARLSAAAWRRERAANCNTLISRLSQLKAADPPLLLLHSHPVTRQLTEQPSPISDADHNPPRRPDRRPALRLDRSPVGASRTRPLPGPRPRSRGIRHASSNHHRAGAP